MSNDESMGNLDKLEKLLRQFPNGISVYDIMEKFGWSRSKVYDYLKSLKFQGKAYYDDGIAYPSKPPEKEGLFDALAKDLGISKKELLELVKLSIKYGEEDDL